jgi:hypothetical protein
MADLAAELDRLSALLIAAAHAARTPLAARAPLPHPPRSERIGAPDMVDLSWLALRSDAIGAEARAALAQARPPAKTAVNRPVERRNRYRRRHAHRPLHPWRSGPYGAALSAPPA